jgi:hypothetical protein
VSGPGFPPADLARAAALARAVDIFYNRGRAVPWFAAVTRACRMDAARFLEGYADFLDRRAGEQAPAPGSPHGRIEASQLEWLAEVCGAGGTGGAGGSPGAGGKKGAGGSSGPGGPLPSGQAMPVGLFPLIRDLVRLNGACARAYAEGESSQLELSWDPDSLQSPGVLDLRRFLDHVPRRACRVRVASRSGAVAVERVRVAGSTPGRRR